MHTMEHGILKCGDHQPNLKKAAGHKRAYLSLLKARFIWRKLILQFILAAKHLEQGLLYLYYLYVGTAVSCCAGRH